MSKYLTIFNTEAQWQAAQDTLDYPNVSLIDTTGDLHYTTYPGQDVANAPFGSILMAEVATNKLFYIEDSANYNLTDYPFADYKPIAVCIYDKESNANNQTVFLAVQWADYTALGTPKASAKSMCWGFSNVDLSSKVTGIRDLGTNHISSISINNEMKKLVTVDYSGTSIPHNYDDGESPAFCSAWRFKTPGTNDGEWYLPSYYDMMKYQKNYTTIQNIFTIIKNIAGNQYLNSLSGTDFLCCERANNSVYTLTDTGQFNGYSDKNNNLRNVRPVFIAGINEL